MLKAFEQNVTANFHKFGISPKRFMRNQKLSDFFAILTTSTVRSHLHPSHVFGMPH